MSLKDTEVAEYVELHGFASTDQIAKRFSVSEMTIRRALQRLEENRRLIRVRSGAVPGRSIHTYGRGFVTNMYLHRDEKQEIARFAVGLVSGCRTLFLDTGSTCYLVAKMLPENSGITVITYSLDIVSALRSKPGVRVVCPGGELDSTLNVFAGPHAEQILESFTADVSLLGAGAVDNRMGTQEDVLVQIPIKKIMNRNSTRSYLLVDSGKLGRRSYFSSIPVDQIAHIITSEKADMKFVEHVRQAGVEVVMVPVCEHDDEQDNHDDDGQGDDRTVSPTDGTE